MSSWGPMGFGTSLFLVHDSIVLYSIPTPCHSCLLPCPLPPHVCMQVCVCRPVYMFTCTQHTHTHMHTHTPLSTPDFVVKALGLFKRNQCIFCCCCCFQVFDSWDQQRANNSLPILYPGSKELLEALQKIPKVYTVLEYFI